MTILMIYITGVILSLSLYLSYGIKKGVITMSDLFVIVVAAVISWFGVVIYLLHFVDFDSIIIWRRKK